MRRPVALVLAGGLLAAGCGPSAPPPVDPAAERAAEEDMKTDAAKEAGRRDLDDDPPDPGKRD